MPRQLLYHHHEENAEFSAPFVHDGEIESIGDTETNDTSVFRKYGYGNTSVLFNGELKSKAGNCLASESHPPESTIIAGPYHGADIADPSSW